MIPLSLDLAALELRADALREKALEDESGFGMGALVGWRGDGATVSRNVIRTERDAARAKKAASR